MAKATRRYSAKLKFQVVLEALKGAALLRAPWLPRQPGDGVLSQPVQVRDPAAIQSCFRRFEQGRLIQWS